MRTSKLVVAGLLLVVNQVLATNLTITSSGSQVILSWPQASTNEFYLQTAANLSSPVEWSNTADPTANGGTLTVTNQATSTSSFYRLQPWEVLFDGTNTSAFRSPSSTLFPSNSWFLTNGMLVSKVVANADGLMTIGTYTNFELRVLWKCVTNGNSGIFYRYTPQVNSAVPEYQLFDDANVATAHYNNAQYTYQSNLMAAVYALIAPTNKTLVPTGQWNDCRVVVQGYHAKHWLNGKVVVDYQIDSPAYRTRIPQDTNTYIVFQNKGTGDDGITPGIVYYGYMKIRRLP
jgi:hypothetical protein